MKFVAEVELGNEVMQTAQDVTVALAKTLTTQTSYTTELVVGESGSVSDDNGNTVGKWEVVES